MPISSALFSSPHRLVDNFCICEGYSVPRCLMYEIYVETCGHNAQTQVNPATFGKVGCKDKKRVFIE